MKDFNKIEQFNDSSTSQWEMTPAEIVEMKEEQSRRELAETKLNYNDILRAQYNTFGENSGLHESISNGETSKDRLERTRKEMDYWGRKEKIESSLDSKVSDYSERKQFIKDVEDSKILGALRHDADEKFYNRGFFRKGWDFVTSGFSKEKVRDKYYKKYNDQLAMSDHINPNYIRNFDYAGYSELDDSGMNIDQYIEEVNNRIKDQTSWYDDQINKETERANRDISDMKRWSVQGTINKNRRMPSDFRSWGYGELDSVTVKKSIRRNQKKNQK